VGALLAHVVQTQGGNIAVEDVRFTGESGTPMSALLYVPETATSADPAPGILAVHGYINSRETQSGFAIELARRGYVVLALDQTGHGFSAPPAFAHGFGGPDGLAYLRALPMVDASRIGLEGHSMGGWAVLAAAALHPDAYRAMVLEGSSPGSFGAPDGTSAFPRNVAVVFSAYDEFADLMWGVPAARKIGESEKLQRLFGAADPVEPGRPYGDIRSGTARIWHAPPVTHPGDHHSHAAIGHALDWFERTIPAPHARAASDQVWVWKEVGTALVLVGVVLLLIGFADAGLGLAPFRGLPAEERLGEVATDRLGAVALFVLPVVTYLPLFKLAERWLPPSGLLPQQLTNGVTAWVIGNAAITLVLLAFLRRRRASSFSWHGIGRALVLAVLAVGATYLVLLGVFLAFAVDARVWVVALKPLAAWHFAPFAVYLLPMLVFFPLLGIVLSSVTTSPVRAAGLLSGGFVVFLAVQYLPLLAGAPMPLGEPLLTIVAFQFVAVLAIVGLITAVFLRRTGNPWLGGFVNALFVAWLVVAGQATHV